MGEKKLMVQSELLTDAIIKGIQEKKGLDIVSIDLRKIKNSICDFFIICSGSSNTHVNAIAHSIEKIVLEDTAEKVWHAEGYETSEWILLDYSSHVVHIFQEETRKFYNLEALWADGILTNYDAN